MNAPADPNQARDIGADNSCADVHRCAECGHETPIARFAAEALIRCDKCRQPVAVSKGVDVQTVIGVGVIVALVAFALLFGRLIRVEDPDALRARVDSLASAALDHALRNAGRFPESLQRGPADRWVPVYNPAFASGEIILHTLDHNEPLVWLTIESTDPSYVPVAFVGPTGVTVDIIDIVSADSLESDLAAAAAFLDASLPGPPVE